MTLWDHDGKPVACEDKDITPGVLNVISGVSDRYDRGTCPFCNRSYTQDRSCHHLRNILVVEGDAYWHRTFISINTTRFLSVSADDGLAGPLDQACETCKKSLPKNEMVHVMFAEENDPRVRVVSYCCDTCAVVQWQNELKGFRGKETVQQWLRDSAAT